MNNRNWTIRCLRGALTTLLYATKYGRFVEAYGEKATSVEGRLREVLEEMLALMDEARSDKWKKTLARRAAEDELRGAAWKYPPTDERVKEERSVLRALHEKVQQGVVYLVAAPASQVQPGGLIDARAGHPAMLESAADARETLDHHVQLSDTPLTVYRCQRDMTWWKVLP